MKVDGSSTGSLVLMKYSDQDTGLVSQVYSYRTRVLINCIFYKNRGLAVIVGSVHFEF